MEQRLKTVTEYSVLNKNSDKVFRIRISFFAFFVLMFVCNISVLHYSYCRA